MFLFRCFWSILFALTILASCSRTAPPSAPLQGRRPPPVEALSKDWLDGGSSLRREYFERLLDLVAQDPEAVALVQRAVTAFKRRDHGDLFDLFSICPEDTPKDSGGHTFFNYDLGVFSLDVESLASGKLSAHAQAQLDEVLASPTLMRYLRKNFPDYVLIYRSMVPRICMVRGLDLGTAYETLIHELTHATLRDPHYFPKKASETDEATFLESSVQAPGDEVDAYIAGIRARIRVEKNRNRVHRQLQRYFDDQGNLVAPRLQIARAILAPAPAGLGYAQSSLQDAYARALEAERAELFTRLQVVEATLVMRREQQEVLSKNAEVHAHNLKVYQQQAELARSKGDKASQIQTRQKTAEANRNAEEIRRMLPVVEASLRRLEQEAASLHKVLEQRR
ncbi:MAG: hypothetical protein RMJ98_10125 [Myxococcales bacterium]|nr:hypothetical protein [Polyangiaceae bacterium]MDW8249646.1 hypothetical protein [Myxococcales bacterium]